MDIEVKLTVDEKSYEFFQYSLSLLKLNEKDMFDYLLKLHAYNMMDQLKQEDVKVEDNVYEYPHNIGKAIDRIPLWAHKRYQYNHKIIKAYFRLLNSMGNVTLHNLRLMCSNPENKDVYVPTFNSNYASMKTDSGQSHGRVFIDDGKYVKIASDVEETLMRYKRFFE